MALHLDSILLTHLYVYPLGNPVSALVSFHLFALPALRQMAGFASPALPIIHVKVSVFLSLDCKCGDVIPLHYQCGCQFIVPPADFSSVFVYSCLVCGRCTSQVDKFTVKCLLVYCAIVLEVGVKRTLDFGFE